MASSKPPGFAVSGEAKVNARRLRPLREFRAKYVTPALKSVFINNFGVNREKHG